MLLLEKNNQQSTGYKKLHQYLLDSFLLMSGIDFSQAVSLLFIKTPVDCRWSHWPVSDSQRQKGVSKMVALFNGLLVGVH